MKVLIFFLFCIFLTSCCQENHKNRNLAIYLHVYEVGNGFVITNQGKFKIKNDFSWVDDGYPSEWRRDLYWILLNDKFEIERAQIVHDEVNWIASLI